MAYSGTPEPYDAPTQRPDFRLGVGWHVTPEHEVWTIQEPYGAFTWYAANDQPADKAYYDFTLTVPAPWTGIANGELTDTTEADGLRTTTWHLAEPASSYLVTVAFADYTPTELESVARRADHHLGTDGRPGRHRRHGVRPRGDGLAGAVPRALPVRHLRDPHLRRRQRHGDPDHGDPRRDAVLHLAGGRRARARAPLVRRHGHARRLERRVDERGHGDVPAGHVGGRGRGHHHRREDGRLGRLRGRGAGLTPVRRPTTTRPTSAPATSTSARP